VSVASPLYAVVRFLFERYSMITWSDLVGKTISEVTQMKMEGWDDRGFVEVKFTDGQKCIIESCYGGYSGNSEDEYPVYLNIYDADEIETEFSEKNRRKTLISAS